VRGACFLPVAVLLAGCSGSPRAEEASGLPESLAPQLRALPGVQLEAEEAALAGSARFYRLSYRQPTDHARPDGETFAQRVTILHRRRDAPTVLYSSGYFVGQQAGEAELTNLLQGNQVSVEHRYFPPSRPEPPAWEHLTFAQAARDHHRVVEALRPLLSGRWLSTGGSKGGLTSLVHRRFFPADVDGTVAYVAPLLEGTADPRFVPFFDRVGDEPCRERLRKFQRTALARRDEVAPVMTRWAAEKGHGFTRLGQDRAYEFAVLELPFFLWQYGTAGDCDGTPADDAEPAKVFAFVDGIVGVADNFVDANIEQYAAYWQHCATELGGPRFPDAHLVGVMKHRGEDVPSIYAPPGAPTVYSPAPAADVARWIREEGERLIVVYGENDPWTAAAVDLGGARDSLRVTVLGGNHQSRLRDAPAGERSRAFSALERWAGRGLPGAAPRSAPELVQGLHLRRDAAPEPWHLRYREAHPR